MNLRLLLLEDDVVSATFLREALRTLPAQVDHASDLGQARQLADAGQSLWLFDARLPDGHGADLLAELRGRGLQAPALALTAGDDPAALRRLEAAGFAKVLRKPVTIPALHAAVRECLAETSGQSWDDAAARAALGGDQTSVLALRRLFLQELPAQMRDVQAACAQGDIGAAREQLHRLKAGCGFVGAMRLLGLVRRLHSNPDDARILARFLAHAEELLAGA